MKQLAIVFLLISVCACSEDQDFEKERKAILSILERDRKAHFDENVELFVSEYSGDLVSVNRGIVSRPTREETKKRFQSYFDRVEFVKWDDIAAPEIKFSNDGSLAYAIVQKLFVLSVKDSLNRSMLDTTEFAWVSIYRKSGNKWKGELNASTNK